MGVFGPSKKQQEQAHQEWLRTGVIEYNQQWGRHRTGRIPELIEVAAQATVDAGRDPATVDVEAATRRLVIGLLALLEPLLKQLKLSWDDCLVVLERPDVSMELLTKYLTTLGAAGIAAHDKVAQLMTRGAVTTLAQVIRDGGCDFVPGAAASNLVAPSRAMSLDAALGRGLLDSGLEQMSPGLYRGTVDSPLCAGRRHNVFVGIVDGETPTVMTPVGLIENVADADLARARDHGDGCEASAAASFRVLIRPLRVDPAAPDLDAVLAAATDLAAYGDLVQERLTAPPQDAVQSLAKGQNVPLPAINLDVRVRWWGAPPGCTVDCSGLLLGGSGRVRGDHDFVFYNQPRHGQSSVHYVPAGAENGASVGGLRIMLLSIEHEVERVVVVASTNGTPLSSVRGLEAEVVDMDTGARVFSFAPTGVGPESALVLCEVYRRAGAWRLRAVGQGYATGLAGVATDFGITVDS